MGEITLADGYWDEPVPPPELWHCDDVVWRRRSRLGRLAERALAGEDVHALVLEDGEGITQDDLGRFWNEFVPALARLDRHSLRGLGPFVAELRAHYDGATLHRFDRIAGRYGAFLTAKLEPLANDKGLRPAMGLAVASLDVKSYAHLGLLTRHILLEGRDAFDAVVRDPARAAGHLRAMSLASGLFMTVVLHHEHYVTQARRYRLLDALFAYEGRPPPTPAAARAERWIKRFSAYTWGAVEMIDFLKTQFEGPEDAGDVPQACPRFRLEPSGEIRRVGAQEPAVAPPAPESAPSPGAPGVAIVAPGASSTR
jgi:hypothetical protein